MLRGILRAHVTRYDHDKFWRRYLACQNDEIRGLRRLYYIYYLKRMMSMHCCDFMVAMSGRDTFGAFFAAPPFLPHGLNGIVISDQATIGKNATIFQQVTIGVKDTSIKGAPTL